MRDRPCSKRHASHEDREHESLRVGGVSKEEFEVVRPDGFVYESGEPGYDKHRE